MVSADQLILHITTRDEWQTAEAAGIYRTPSLESEGFIHFSFPEQVIRTANAFYTGQADLVLLCVDVSQLDAELRIEQPAGEDSSERFPHVYGALNVDVVLDVLDFPPDDDGTFRLPEELASR